MAAFLLLLLSAACAARQAVIKSPTEEPPQAWLVSMVNCYRACDNEMLAFEYVPLAKRAEDVGRFRCSCKTKDQIPTRSRVTPVMPVHE